MTRLGWVLALISAFFVAATIGAVRLVMPLAAPNAGVIPAPPALVSGASTFLVPLLLGLGALAVFALAALVALVVIAVLVLRSERFARWILAWIGRRFPALALAADGLALVLGVMGDLASRSETPLSTMGSGLTTAGSNLAAVQVPNGIAPTGRKGFWQAVAQVINSSPGPDLVPNDPPQWFANFDVITGVEPTWVTPPPLGGIGAAVSAAGTHLNTASTKAGPLGRQLTGASDGVAKAGRLLRGEAT